MKISTSSISERPWNKMLVFYDNYCNRALFRNGYFYKRRLEEFGISIPLSLVHTFVWIYPKSLTSSTQVLDSKTDFLIIIHSMYLKDIILIAIYKNWWKFIDKLLKALQSLKSFYKCIIQNCLQSESRP